MSNEQLSWFLLSSKPREEQRGLTNLQNQGIEAFYPTRQVEKVRKGIRSIKSEVLFPNYLFVQLNPQLANFNAIRSTRGIAGFVRFGNEYARVADEIISNLKQLSAKTTATTVDQELPQPGNPVVIKKGIYRGLNAIYQASDGLERSVLLVKMLEQQASLTLQNSDFDLT